VLAGLPVRHGHFLLESGYHTDSWLTLDSLFVDQRAIAPLVRALAEKLSPYKVPAICGPLLGGAFLAQALAIDLGVEFFFTVPDQSPRAAGLFTAEYWLAPAFQRQIAGKRVAVVDDVISAGSSARATIAAVRKAGGDPAVAAALLVLGEVAITHFASEGIAMETVARREFVTWTAERCPLCGEGVPLEHPV
jgi:orotate phosphoribosyltransferase